MIIDYLNFVRQLYQLILAADIYPILTIETITIVATLLRDDLVFELSLGQEKLRIWEKIQFGLLDIFARSRIFGFFR